MLVAVLILLGVYALGVVTFAVGYAIGLRGYESPTVVISLAIVAALVWPWDVVTRLRGGQQ